MRLPCAGLCFALATIGAPLGCAVAAAPPARPNIVFILADDLGYGDVKCTGGERCRIDTPGFDRLAAEGVRFTDAHPAATVCVPSRVAIMTGRLPWRVRGARDNGPWGFLTPRFPKDQFTLGHLLRGAGYRTGYVGKWHLGTRMQTTDGRTQGPSNVDYSRPLLQGPVEHGFESFILPGSLDMFPYVFARNGEWLGPVTKQRGWSAFNRVGPAADDFEDWKVLDTFSGEAERFIGRHAAAAKRGRPFFLYLALTSPHTPLSPRPAFEGKSRVGVYGDFVMETDDCVVRVLRTLDDHGLAGDTLVMATSDHGPASYAGFDRKATPGQVRRLEAAGHFPSGPYRGYKFSVYEGGLRVPFVARWPGVVPAGSTCDRLVGLVDLVATCADVAGADLAEDQAPDSVSFLPLLKNPAGAAPTRGTLILQGTRPFVVREGRWKLALCPGSGSGGGWGNTPTAQEAWALAVEKLGREPGEDDLRRAPFVQLFDLGADPGETRNLAPDEPGRVQAMIGILEKAIADGRTTPGPRLANDFKTIRILPRKPGPAPVRR